MNTLQARSFPRLATAAALMSAALMSAALMSVAILAACTTTPPSSPPQIALAATIGNTQLRLTPPLGHCLLSDSQPSDSRALQATRISVAPLDKRATVRGGAALFLYESDRSR